MTSFQEQSFWIPTALSVIHHKQEKSTSQGFLAAASKVRVTIILDHREMGMNSLTHVAISVWKSVLFSKYFKFKNFTGLPELELNEILFLL